MKKNIICAVTALLAYGPLVAEEKVPSPAPVLEQEARAPLRLGQDAIAQIRKDYQEGRYDDFLKDMDAIATEDLSSLAHLRQGVNDHLEWAKAANLLHKERSQELKEAVAGKETPLAKKVRAAAREVTTQEQDLALRHLTHFRQMPPGTGKNNDENRLIDLDLAYEYKSIRLDEQHPSDRREKHYVLKMERADQLLAAAQTFQDASLKKDVELFATNLDARLAQNWDQSDLIALLYAPTKAADPLQNKILSILETHQDKMGELAHQYFESGISASGG